MSANGELAAVSGIMRQYADRTGLSHPGRPPRRYLWSDAHAVCNLLGLYRASGDDDYRDLALSLIDQVHATLGRHRPDDTRKGWLSGLEDAEGAAHPTAGGLRIGKALTERKRDEPIDEQLEWERDGQYFHYLTKWMHALCRAAEVAGDARYGRWAAELAAAAYAGFVTSGPGGERLYWKMSIDLSYPLVASSGHHDPLDGFISTCEASLVSGIALAEEKLALERMLAGRQWATVDPLGIGGLLFDAYRLIQLKSRGGVDGADLPGDVLASATQSLALYMRESSLHLPADYRLAFREFGLSIGLRAVERMCSFAKRQASGVSSQDAAHLTELRRFVPIADEIESFWRKRSHQASPSWRDHEDINSVMLATSLLPDQFLAV